MDDSGRKILIGILIAIVAGVCLYFFVYNVAASPSESAPAQATRSQRPAENGGVSPEAYAVSRAMVGMWRSDDDPKLTREFDEDGTVIDRYDGDMSATAKGMWGAFTADMALADTTGLAEGVVYIQMTINNTSLYFSVLRAADSLELVALNRGSQTNFTRVQ